MRKISHALHAVTFLALLGTGLLLFFPSLREQITGGYSLLIKQFHCWLGVALLLPFPFLWILARQGALSFPHRYGGNPLWIARWRRGHFLFTIGGSMIFFLTGVILWRRQFFIDALVNWSFIFHEVFTLASCFWLAVHLFLVLTYTIRRTLSKRFSLRPTTGFPRF